MTTTDKPKTNLPFGIDSYQDWVKREGLLVHQGLSLHTQEADVGDWPRYGAKGAAAHFTGSGDYARCSSSKSPPGKSTEPVQHLYEAIYFVLDGRGSTQLEFADGRTRQFEWGPRSMFAIPLNAKYRHFNASGVDRARLAMTTNAPMVMKMFHNDDFIFNLPYEFDEPHLGTRRLLQRRRRPAHDRSRQEHLADELRPRSRFDRADRLRRARPRLAQHQVRAGRQHHAHAHLGDRARDLQESAPARRRHARHDAHRRRLLAALESRRHRLRARRLEVRYGVSAVRAAIPPALRHQQQRLALPRDGPRRRELHLHRAAAPHGRHRRQEKSASKTSIKMGGDQIEYEDQDPRIHQIWLEEMRKAGITPKLILPQPAKAS